MNMADGISLFIKIFRKSGIKKASETVAHTERRIQLFSFPKETADTCSFSCLLSVSENFGIPNLHRINGNCLRGESLFQKRNRHLIPQMRECGIRQIIDLKTADFSERFQKMVENNGMAYFHFPMDSEKTSTREIINNLPKLFERLNKGSYYIACAQGLHRTDIALALNFLFNAKASKVPPVLYGHRTAEGLRHEDILKRANSIFRELTEQDRVKLGLVNFDEKAFKAKKKLLILANSQPAQ